MRPRAPVGLQATVVEVHGFNDQLRQGSSDWKHSSFAAIIAGMQESGLQQRLLAILAADGVGYSRLMALDAAATVAALDSARAVFREQLAAHGGQVVDTAGDSVLAVFDTASGALKAALAVQAQLARIRGEAADPLRFRIGVHLGDVLAKDDGSVYGDGVNVAARLQTLAEPDGVTASQAVLSAVQGRVAASFEDIGEQAVKNIAQPVRAFRVHADPNAPGPRWRRITRVAMLGAVAAFVVAVGTAAVYGWRARGPVSPAVADRVALAVLPFANVGDDKANESFADGVTDELIDLLSRAQGLQVTPRGSAYFFKGKSMPAAEVARQLGVSYLVEGSVRRAGERMRISAQLVNAADGAIRWSRIFDRDLKDLLKAQNEIALGIAGSLAQPLSLDLTSGGRGTTNVEAWIAFQEAQRLPVGKRVAAYERVLALDPTFARAHAAMAMEVLGFAFSRELPRQEVSERMTRHLEAALRVDPRYDTAYGLLGAAARIVDDMPALRRAAQRALEADPDSSAGHGWMAELHLHEGDVAAALTGFRRSVERLPLVDWAHGHFVDCLRFANRPAEALQAVEQALALRPDSMRLQRSKVLALVELGRIDEALKLARERDMRTVLLRFGTPEDRAAMLQRKGLSPHDTAWQQYWLGRPDAVVEHLYQEHSQDLQDRNPVLYSPEYDLVRELKSFKEWLARHKLTEAHQRAQAWRAANPVRKAP